MMFAPPETITSQQITDALAALGITDLTGFQAVLLTTDGVVVSYDGTQEGTTVTTSVTAAA